MHNEPRQQLCQLIAQYGRSLSEDPRRCGALLKDYCGQYKREIFVLVSALENRVATELMNASAGVPESILLSRLSKRLEDELGLAETAAKWAVETWALALGVITQPLSVSVPTPVQTTQPVSQGSATLISSFSSTGGKLKFPKFSVGKVKIGSKEQAAVGEIDVVKGQKIELTVADDVTDFSFLETCDPDKLVSDLNLKGCKNFDDSKLEYLKKLTSLQFLNLSNCEINGYSFNKQVWTNINNLKNLISLDLSGCNSFQDDGLEYIRKITALRSLNLNMIHGKYGLGNIFITDKGLENIGKLTNLEMLDLSKFTEITGPGVLAYLGHMTQLKSLDLSQCIKVSSDRLQELKQMLPNTRILP
ncbi:MAG TPA: hypothetical protein P5102_13675 [Candidatus Competibacteraceae bacterium]|nr:hypothetical protein [Candidatus Competibacteraceae bacterium]HRZ07171.1 hypothetical protein [Candidatus Competibacteraceae bacterium]